MSNSDNIQEEQGAERERFNVYIIPKLANGSDEPIPKLFSANENKQVYLPNNTPYAVGLTSDFDLPAEATVHIDNRSMGIFYLKPFGSLHLKRSSTENKGFVFIACDSPEAKFIKCDILNKHLGQVKVNIRPMDRSKCIKSNPLGNYPCLTDPNPMVDQKQQEDKEEKHFEYDDNQVDDDLKYKKHYKGLSSHGEKTKTTGVRVVVDAAPEDETDGFKGFTAFGQRTDQRFFKVHRVPTKGSHEFVFYLKSGDIKHNKSKLGCYCGQAHVTLVTPPVVWSTTDL